MRIKTISIKWLRAPLIALGATAMLLGATATAEAQINGIASQATVDALEIKLDTLDTSNLDATVTSRASQTTVDALEVKADTLEGKADALSTAVDDLRKCKIQVVQAKRKHFVLLLTVSGEPVAFGNITRLDVFAVSYKDDLATLVDQEAGTPTEITGSTGGLVHVEADHSDDVKDELLKFEVDVSDSTGDVACSKLLNTDA